jgi:hypothetical protein
MLGEPVGVRVMLAQAQNSVVFQQSIEDIQGFTRRARDDPGAEDRVLIGRVRKDRDGAR